MAFVEAAEAGDPDAMQAVHHAIAWFVGEGEPIPEVLRPYLFELLLLKPPTRKRKRGRHHENYLRDDLIRLAVRTAEGFGFSRTRNEATDGPSACSIVSEELAARIERSDIRVLRAIATPNEPALNPSSASEGCTVPCKEQAGNRRIDRALVFCTLRLCVPLTPRTPVVQVQRVAREPGTQAAVHGSPQRGPRDASVAGWPSRGRPKKRANAPAAPANWHTFGE
jgi:hypothetical protein